MLIKPKKGCPSTSQQEAITITAKDRIVWYLILPASVGIASYVFNSFRYEEWQHWTGMLPPAIGSFIGIFVLSMVFPQLIERQERYKNLSMKQKIFRNSLFLLLVGLIVILLI